MTAALERSDQYSGRLAAEVLSAARSVAWHRGRVAEAGVLAQRALALWREIDEPEAIGYELLNTAPSAQARGDAATHRAVLEQAVQHARDNQLTDTLPAALNNLGDLAIREGRLSEGRALCTEGLAVSQSGSSSALVSLLNLAYIQALEGHHPEATTLAREALDAAVRRGDLLWSAWAATISAWPLAEQGALMSSARLLGAGIAALENSGARRDWMDDACYEAVYTIVSDQLGEPAVQTLIDQGRTLSVAEAARDAFPNTGTPTSK